MKVINLTMYLAVLFFAPPAPAEQYPCLNSNDAECKEINKSRCMQANENMLQSMRSTPLDKPRDIERNRELIARVEKMLADNRRQGRDECRSWEDFNHILVHQ
jgi:hypothetical protein